MKRVHKGPKPTKKDWTQVFKPVDYEFAEGWHYRAVMMLVLTFSVVSMLLVWKLQNGPRRPSPRGFIGVLFHSLYGSGCWHHACWEWRLDHPFYGRGSRKGGTLGTLQ